MKVIKVVVDELPEGCLHCLFLDMVYGNECPLNDKKIDNIHTRPDWCPLMTLKHQLKLWEYAQTGDWNAEKESKE
jgi:hypothetical protein